MKKRFATLSLIFMPVALIGIVQIIFAGLSLFAFRDSQTQAFFLPGCILLILSATLFALSQKLSLKSIRFRDALLFSTFTWVIVGFLGAIPIYTVADISFTNAVFESISAVTTTGATKITGLDDLPATLLMYRQFLQWLGGLGIVVFVVAILPMVNSGGMRLLKTESPGPIKDNKLAPRVAKTAHYLWMVYLLLTFFCAIAYYCSGMNCFEAIAHSLTTVSTGGFSTHDASIGYFHNQKILAVADFFMLCGAINFGLHFNCIYRKKAGLYFQDEETRVFLLIVLTLSIVLIYSLSNLQDFKSEYSIISNSVFHLISFISSTGFAADNISGWPTAILFLLIISSYLGGCAGSTAGGNKIIRSIIAFKLLLLEMKVLIHPRGVFHVKYNKKPVDESILNAAMAFMAITAFSSMFLTLLLMMVSPLDFFSAFSGVAACVNVLGPAFGELGSNFQPVNPAGTWILSFAMILGRLEYFTVFALLLPRYWKF